MAKILVLLGDRAERESEGFQMFSGLSQIATDIYSCARYRDAEFFITPDVMKITIASVPLEQYDLVYLRDFHGYEPERNTIADYCAARRIKFVNSDVAISQKISKLAQYSAFSLTSASVAFPRSVYAHPTQLKKAVEKELAYPLVVKSILGRGGNDNHYVKTAQELEKLLASATDMKFIAQEAIPNSGDYRVIVLGETVGCVSYRTSKRGDHRNNVAQGSVKEYLNVQDIPTRVKDLAVNAARTLGRDVCGVDIMIDNRNNQPLVLEANFNFGIQTKPGQLPQELYGLSEYLHRRARDQ